MPFRFMIPARALSRYSFSLAGKQQQFSKSATYKYGGGWQKQYLLSEPLASLVGADELSRPQVVKEIWKHIKSHGLQDPSDKRYIMCDATMQAVFKTDGVHMFTMNKLLSEHLQERRHFSDEY